MTDSEWSHAVVKLRVTFALQLEDQPEIASRGFFLSQSGRAWIRNRKEELGWRQFTCNTLCCHLGGTSDIQEMLIGYASIINEICIKERLNYCGFPISGKKPRGLPRQISCKRNCSCDAQRHINFQSIAGRGNPLDSVTQLPNLIFKNIRLDAIGPLKLMGDCRYASRRFMGEWPDGNQCKFSCGAPHSNAPKTIECCYSKRHAGATSSCDCSPGVPVHFASTAQPPALTHSIQHIHLFSTFFQKKIFPVKREACSG